MVIMAVLLGFMGARMNPVESVEPLLNGLNWEEDRAIFVPNVRDKHRPLNPPILGDFPVIILCKVERLEGIKYLDNK
jgi:hypothetical protein